VSGNIIYEDRRQVKTVASRRLHQEDVANSVDTAVTLQRGCMQSAMIPTYDHTHPFNRPLSGTTRVSRYQKGKANLDFTEARDSGSGISWAVCKSASGSRQITIPAPHHSSFLQAGCPSCRPTNSVKALEALPTITELYILWSELSRPWPPTTLALTTLLGYSSQI